VDIQHTKTRCNVQGNAGHETLEAFAPPKASSPAGCGWHLAVSCCFHVRRHCISFALERLCLEALQLWQGTMLQVLLAQHFFCAI